VFSLILIEISNNQSLAAEWLIFLNHMSANTLRGQKKSVSGYLVAFADDPADRQKIFRQGICWYAARILKLRHTS
jgi:hypothetical protein